MPKIPEITENPEVPLSNLWLRTLYYSLFAICPLPLLFPFYYCLTIYCLDSYNREYRPTHAIVFPLLFRLLLFHLLIVLTYYTALNWHSISSSTFFLYDSLSRVSCLSWQSTHFRFIPLSVFETSIPVAETVHYPFYNCRRDGSSLISIILDLADRSLISLYTNTVMRTVIQNTSLLGRQGYHSILVSSITVAEAPSQPSTVKGTAIYLVAETIITFLSRGSDVSTSTIQTQEGQHLAVTFTMPLLTTMTGGSPARSTTTMTSIASSPTTASNSNRCRLTLTPSNRLAPLANPGSCLHKH